MMAFQVIELRNDGAGFGFGISGSRNRSSHILDHKHQQHLEQQKKNDNESNFKMLY